MKAKSILAFSVALGALTPAISHAQDAPAAVEDNASDDDDVIVVTARKREETLLDVPVAASAISGETLEERGINSVREAAALAPGLNINSDGTGRAFVAIRGVGVTLVQSVQPGVGLFIDGIYQPNTAYLNNPLLDVARIEVLRGPQGTLYGKNTLGGAINVITRQPGDVFEGRFLGSYAGPDDSWMASGAIGGPIVEDALAVRVAYSHRQQQGFQTNSVLGGIKANPYNSDSISATMRAGGSDGVAVTVKGYYDWVEGVNIPYSRVLGPTDYSRVLQFNALNRINYKYRGINAKVDLPIESINTDVTFVVAYDTRDGVAPDSDADFGPANIARSNGNDALRTRTVELRFDSEWSDKISTLVGLFYSRETARATDVTTIVPFSLVRTTQSDNVGDTYAAFGTVFIKPSDGWEIALGLRYDDEHRVSRSSVVSVIGAGAPTGGPLPVAEINSSEWQPKATISRKWNDNVMSYASVSRGYRGGGFNAPTAPFRTYKGDSAWTYELGSKYQSDSGAFILSGALFYNDYKNYVGLNSIAPAAGGGLVTVDLNSGDVESYGAELEMRAKPVDNWTITGGLTLMRARLTNTDAYTATTGRVLSSDRLTFQPDVSGSLYSDYEIPIGGDSSITLTGGMTYKGKRLAGTLNETTPTFLNGYALFNAAVTLRTGAIELSAFANNIFDTEYFESYIEKTTLILAGVPASDLGIMGDGARYGIRASYRF